MSSFQSTSTREQTNLRRRNRRNEVNAITINVRETRRRENRLISNNTYYQQRRSNEASEQETAAAEDTRQQNNQRQRRHQQQRMQFHETLESKWNKECRYGCGYIHLDCATENMLSNCCYNGLLSPTNGNSNLYDKLGMLHPLSENMSKLMIENIEHFGKLSSAYNNIVAISATGVTNSHYASNLPKN